MNVIRYWLSMSSEGSVQRLPAGRIDTYNPPGLLVLATSSYTETSSFPYQSNL
jgi:hypothetical protein